MSNINVYVLRYGFYHEHDTIFGVYSSHYYAKKAKDALVQVTENGYDYYSIKTFILNDKLPIKDK